MDLMHFDRRSCFERAHELLATGDDDLLRYACLELRFCLEAIMYDKLRAYASRLPTKIYAKWQPPQALKALLQIEPRADQDFVVRICREDEPGKPSGDWMQLGTHQTFRLARLRKIYNQLGNYLHVPSPSAQDRDPPSPASAKIREDLLGILQELEPVVRSTIDGRMFVAIPFECSKCGTTILCNEDALRETHRATCVNTGCEAEFEALEGPDGKLSLRLISSVFTCIQCEHQHLIESRLLRVDYTFPCPECGAIHRVVEPRWAYGLIDSDGQLQG